MPEFHFPRLPLTSHPIMRPLRAAEIESLTVNQLTSGVVAAQHIILATRDDVLALIESDNYVPGVSGWRIDSDGNAEFNDVTVRGDLASGNWDGDLPLDLFDAGASAGWAWQSASGSGQVMGDLWVGGDITLVGSGSIATAASGRRIEIPASPGERILFHSNLVNEFEPGRLLIDNLGVSLTSPWLSPEAGGALGTISAQVNIQRPTSQLNIYRDREDVINQFQQANMAVRLGEDSGEVGFPEAQWTILDSTIGFSQLTLNLSSLTSTVPLRAASGSAATPSYSFSDESNLGMFRESAGTLAFSSGGTGRLFVGSSAVRFAVQSRAVDGSAGAPGYSFADDTNTGMYRLGDDSIAFSNGGTVFLGLTPSGIFYFNEPVTGAGANVAHEASTGRIFRSVSTQRIKENIRPILPSDMLPSLIDKERVGKSEDWRNPVLDLIPVRYTSIPDAERGDDRSFVGLISEQVADVFPEASDGEGWDVNMVLAALLAKVKEQESRISVLEGAE